MLENHLVPDIFSICVLNICIQKFNYYKIKRQESCQEFQIHVYECVIVKTKYDRSQCAIMSSLCGRHALISNHVTLFVCCPNM